jgi:hypothetical protein
MISAARPTQGENWMSSKAAGDFSITLRLYNPSTVAPEELAKMDFPKVTLVDCTGAQTEVSR